jgi:predicted amidophosphoribosyltransferase
VGFWNPHAICPNCRANIHTLAMGLQTGKQCPNCGVALKGHTGLLTNREAGHV